MQRGSTSTATAGAAAGQLAAAVLWLVSATVSVTAAGGCGSGGRGDAAPPRPDAAVDAVSVDTRRGSGKFGDPCLGGADCEAGHCLSTGRCSKPCAGPSDCPPFLPWTCATGAATPYCACKPLGTERCDGIDDDCDGVADNDAACGGGRSCVAGSCVCGGDTKDCGAAVCTDIASDPSNCGDCDNACTAPAFATSTCAGKQCAYACMPDHGDCDGQASNGCETDLRVEGLHCGRCQRSCLGAACAAALCAPEQLAGDLFSISSFAFDSTDVYWTLTTEVQRMPISGSIVTFNGSYTPRHIVLDATTAYIASLDQIVALPKNGDPALVLATGQGTASRLALDATHVYWAADPAQELRRVAKTGGPVTTLVSQLTLFRDAAVRGQELFWADGDKLFKMPLPAGAQTTLSTTYVRSLAVDGSHAFWTNHSGEVRMIPSGGGAETVLAGGQDTPGGLAIDATHVYWPTLYDGTVMRVSKAGGPAEPIAAQQNHPREVLVDATHVYWLTLTAIWRAPK